MLPLSVEAHSPCAGRNLLLSAGRLYSQDSFLAAGICSTSKLVVAKQHISSASLEGPYWWNMNFSPLESITEVRALHSYRHTSLSVLSISGQLSPEDFRLMSLQGNTAIIPDRRCL